MCCLITALFATVLAKEGTSESTRLACYRKLPILCTGIILCHQSHWNYRYPKLDPMGTPPPLLWGRCRSPDSSHIMWKPEEALCKKQMAATAQNAAFQWLRGIRIRERQLVLGHKALHLRLHVWEGTVLWAWRRWNSSKQDSNQKNADGSRMMGIAGTAGAAISAPL